MTRARNETSGTLEAYRSSAERWARVAEEEQARARRAEDVIAAKNAELDRLRAEPAAARVLELEGRLRELGRMAAELATATRTALEQVGPVPATSEDPKR